MTRFAKFCWLVLGYNVLVILWGAFVRATGSGAGCGSHWPLCNGEVLPRAPAMETLIEFTHRLTSGLAGLLVLAMVIWAFRAYPRGHIVRFGALLSLLFIILEALIGMILVRYEWVAHNVSYERAVVMALHLANTLRLLGAFTLTAYWASGGVRFRLRGQGWTGVGVLGALLLMIMLGMSGAVTALGDTLLQLGAIERSPVIGQTLLALRIYHPWMAILISVYMIAVLTAIALQRPTRLTLRLAVAFNLLYVGQLLLGALNVWLKAPVWMQLVHLAVTDILWVMLVIFAAGALAAQPQAAPTVEMRQHPA
ncbi:MAG: COX15/CtaA family protein [Fimbriimonadales bacterium]|nr:COX15/CtaA family protein [Fimbriimonadales bacterium]